MQPYQYGCSICGWDSTASDDEDTALAELAAHYRSEEHINNMTKEKA